MFYFVNFQKNVVCVICFVLVFLLNASCTKHTSNNVVLSKKDNTIVVKENKTLSLIENKIKNKTLTYDDVFNQEYYEYSDKNKKNEQKLDALLNKLKICIKNKQINVDKILSNNIDNLIKKIIDPKNMKYGLYGSKNGELWFAENSNLKAPLNYFQQMFLLEASPSILDEITCKMVKQITSGDKIYKSYYGSFWVVYNKKNKLNNSFKIFFNEVEKIRIKNAKKKKLTNKDLNILKTILDMKEFRKIKTSNTDEYFAKLAFTTKSAKVIKKAEKIISSIEK